MLTKSCAGVLVAAGLAVPALAQEVVTVEAFAVLEASGRVQAVSPTTHAFAGSIEGPYFIDAGEGPIPAGRISCAGFLEADDATGTQIARGRCRMEALDGAVAFGRFECRGFRLVGCAGPFEILGGEGRLEGADGGGTIVLRRYETALAVDARGRIEEVGLGIAHWPDLQVRLPEQR